MAKGPELSLDDILDLASKYNTLRKGNQPPVKAGPMTGQAEVSVAKGFQGTEKAGQAVIDAGQFAASPFTDEEFDRLNKNGFDKGHLSSLALYFGAGATLGRGGKIVKKGVNSVKNARLINKTKLNVMPRRTSGTSTAGIIQDPNSQYALMTALLNRR